MYGDKLKQIRKQLNLSQEEISTQTGVSYRAYTSYERGDRKPSFEFLEAISTKYEVNLNWFIANKGTMFDKKEFITSDNDTIKKFEELIEKKFRERGL